MRTKSGCIPLSPCLRTCRMKREVGIEAEVKCLLNGRLVELCLALDSFGLPCNSEPFVIHHITLRFHSLKLLSAFSVMTTSRHLNYQGTTAANFNKQRTEISVLTDETSSATTPGRTLFKRLVSRYNLESVRFVMRSHYQQTRYNQWKGIAKERHSRSRSLAKPHCLDSGCSAIVSNTLVRSMARMLSRSD